MVFFATFFDNLIIRTLHTKPFLIDSRLDEYTMPYILGSNGDDKKRKSASWWDAKMQRLLPYEFGRALTPEILGFDASSVMTIAGPLLNQAGSLPPGIFKDLEVIKCIAPDLQQLVPGHAIRDVGNLSAENSLRLLILSGQFLVRFLIAHLGRSDPPTLTPNHLHPDHPPLHSTPPSLLPPSPLDISLDLCPPRLVLPLARDPPSP